MQNIVLMLIRGYQILVSPLLGANCRFHPTCSEYALSAVSRHGVLRGGRMALVRILKCHPWHAGGVDPVPPCCPTDSTKAT
jgi:putative membrane protein insertion efficiency factor